MNRSLHRELRFLRYVLPRSFAAFAALTLLASCTTKGGGGTGGTGMTVFVGKILTMDDKGTIAEAVSVDELGRIVKVGTEKDVMDGLGAGVETIRLEPQQVLMPGFIDPHMHLLPTLIQGLLGTHNLAPCLPPPYDTNTPEYCASHGDLLGALQSMTKSPPGKGGSKEFILGMNLDPSRQHFIKGKCGDLGDVNFMDQPKLFLDACVSKDRPVLILDQSGHLAYVNQKAFNAVCGCSATDSRDACDAKCKTVADGIKGGRWVSQNGQFTGLLEESPAFKPFMLAMEKSLPLGLMHTNPIQLVENYEKDIRNTIQDLRRAGLTTIADGGLAGKAQIQTVKFLAEQKNFPLRITGVVTYDSASSEKIQPTGPACDPSKDPQCRLPKWLGAGGIKLWVDGSTQGCTASLESPYQYLTTGHCSDAKEGKADFDDSTDIIKALRPLWNTKAWRFQLHANGNRANKWAIETFNHLQLEAVNPHRVLFIHNTVGEDSISQDIGKMREGTYVTPGGKTVPALDARVTHLIGHVAYWGDAFHHMLGEKTARNIDPTAFDLKYGVPFSLHSDSMVTPSRPLWFVEQAVTRRTWAYPHFKHSYVLGAEHKVSVEQALRAVTVEPARQHEIDQWVGSIEPRKVADFVVLGANPLDYDESKKGDPTKISQIKVIQTYLNGKPTVGND
ncbi:amidohydrolase [Archangium sp. Cb G35]|nr:amidohydrolase [Archangium sp. Cb G35]